MHGQQNIYIYIYKKKHLFRLTQDRFSLIQLVTFTIALKWTRGVLDWISVVCLAIQLAFLHLFILCNLTCSCHFDYTFTLLHFSHDRSNHLLRPSRASRFQGISASSYHVTRFQHHTKETIHSEVHTVCMSVHRYMYEQVTSALRNIQPIIQEPCFHTYCHNSVGLCFFLVCHFVSQHHIKDIKV